MKPSIGIHEDGLKKLCDMLNRTLANNAVLFVKTQNYHWHVKTVHFRDLHKLFQEQYEELFEDQDEIAERIRILGGIALGSMAEFIANTTLTETKGGEFTVRQMLENLLADREQVIRELRESTDTSEGLGDKGTADFFTELVQKHEKAAWMLRSSLIDE
jgi:starvation-inducible DNA-binding protein